MSNSRCTSVEDVEDDEPMHIGSTLDVDGDHIMESTNDEEDEPNSGAISLSDDEEIQLSMSSLIFSNLCLINYIRMTYERVDGSHLCLLQAHS